LRLATAMAGETPFHDANLERIAFNFPMAIL
jgi:hypothetical protein